jgi:hypothetical protein
VKRAVKENDANFANKLRIWTCVGHISNTLEALMSQSLEPPGQPTMETLRADYFPWIPTLLSRIRVCEELPINQVMDQRLERGCRRLYTKILAWPKSPSVEHAEMHVSFTQLNSRRYVSGLRVTEPRASSKGGAPLGEWSATGMIVLSSEEPGWTRRKTASLVGIDIASCETGIVGVNFITTDGKTWYFRPVGDLRPRDGIIKTMLLPPLGVDIVGLMIGSDVRLPLAPLIA